MVDCNVCEETDPEEVRPESYTSWTSHLLGLEYCLYSGLWGCFIE